jgi:peptidoglycan-N-acetylglucosamine deacetylase
MSIYQGKLIELLSIDRKFDKSFLHIRLLFSEEIELLWEIDRDTANLLESKIIFEENYKYRLSLHSTWDSTNMQYTSFFTKTYRDFSEKITFSCSEEYHLELHSIKNMKDLGLLIELPYISIKHSDKQTNRPNSKKFFGMFGWVAVATISVVSTILVGYISHSCITKSLFCGKKPVKAESIANSIDLKIKENQIQKLNQSEDHKKKEIAIIKTNSPNNKAIKSLPESKNSEIKVKSNQKKPDHMQNALSSKFQSVTLSNIINYSIPKGSVALTFDDGPSKYSKEFVNVLKKHRAGGTFFYIGQNVKKYPTSVKYTYSNGFSIGSHSMNHYDFTKLSYKNQENELLQTSKLIKNITQKDTVLFRPPYGAKNKITVELMQKYHYKMVLWNKDTEDWKNHNSNEIIKYVKRSTESGSIILLHETKATLDALPKIIEYLHSKNLKIVSLN